MTEPPQHQERPRMVASLKVRPRVWIGLVIYVGYVAVFYGILALSGVPYPELGDSGRNLFLGAGVPLLVGAVLLAITTTLLGWWRPALFDRHRSKARWPIIAPLLLALAVVCNLAATDWGSYDGAFFAASVVLLLVGFTEEITTRGLLLTGLRSRLGEGWVWFVSTALFAGLHLLNAATGQSLGATLQQVVFAFLAGTSLYILRRVTGTLIWSMVLHGMFDFSTFAVQHGSPGPLVGVSAFFQFGAGILAIIGVAFVIHGADEQFDTTREAVVTPG